MTSGEPLIEKARSNRTTIGLYVTVVALAVALPLQAQTSKNFYEGKTITFLVGSSAGGGTDLTARVIARHIERYISGQTAHRCRQQAGRGRHDRR